MKNAPKVFYAVLNMGLGHASRSLPVIREFRKRGWQVLVGSNGRALEFLKLELPGVTFLDTPAYDLQYVSNGFLLPRLVAQFPRLLKKINDETRFCKQVVARHSPDLIISDHCYGMYHPAVRSYFLSHQIYFEMPRGLQMFAALGGHFNFRYHQDYQAVIIPDLPEEGGGLVSGRLGRIPGNKDHYFYTGLLSSIEKSTRRPDIDVLVSISGPEPQRTIFEQIVLRQIAGVPGKKVVLLGKSESLQTRRRDPSLQVRSHATRDEIQKLFNRARLIVSRPGYSTLMELAELGKPALLVPTPGQTEQVYLARRMTEMGWFLSVPQDSLHLGEHVPRAAAFPGLSRPGATQQSVQRLFKKWIEPYFESPPPS